MEVKQLEFDTVKQIYEEHLTKDFIPAEQKPLIVLHILMKLGLYFCYGLYDENQLKGYAFFCAGDNKKKDAILLDYFVVLDGLRGKGYGTEFMKLLKVELSEYGMILAEVELMEETKESQGDSIKEKRKQFYLKNGWLITSLEVDLFGERLQIYQLPIRAQETESKVYEELNQIYDKMFYEKQVRDRVILSK